MRTKREMSSERVLIFLRSEVKKQKRDLTIRSPFREKRDQNEAGFNRLEQGDF